MNKILYLLFLLAFNLNAQTDSLNNYKLQNRVELLEHKLDLTLSNEKNYKIEKDLLKETYSNNYNRIQTIISIILGLITVLGFFGLNSISKTKKEYDEELSEFKLIKAQIEKDYDKLKENQESVNKQINEINSLNKEQDKKLKILEVKEKTSNLISHGSYLHALEYITIGLELDPNNYDLKNMKSQSYFKMQEFENAIEVNLSILQDDPKKSDTLFNLAELYLIAERNEDFVELRNKNKSLFGLNNNKPMTVYFDLLHSYNLNNLDKIKEVSEKFVSSIDIDAQKKFTNWDFTDIRKVLLKKEDGEIKTRLLHILNVINGGWNKKKYLEEIEKI